MSCTHTCYLSMCVWSNTLQFPMDLSSYYQKQISNSFLSTVQTSSELLILWQKKRSRHFSLYYCGLQIVYWERCVMCILLTFKLSCFQCIFQHTILSDEFQCESLNIVCLWMLSNVCIVEKHLLKAQKSATNRYVVKVWEWEGRNSTNHYKRLNKQTKIE